MASLAEHPRDFWFTTSRGPRPVNEPCSCSNTLGGAANRMLTEVCGKKATVEALRRSYVTAMFAKYQRALCGADGPEAKASAELQLKRAAHIMAHGEEMHACYKLTLDDAGEPLPVEFERLNAMQLKCLTQAELRAPIAVTEICSRGVIVRWQQGEEPERPHLVAPHPYGCKHGESGGTL